MNELQALLSPTSLACNTSTDPADVQLAPLQLTVVNTAQATADMTNSGLRIEFVVDPGGSGSAGALILSQYSSGQNASGSPAPLFAVEASAASGTAWTITQAQDAPCAFTAIPDAGAGLLTASPGPGQPGGNISFVFANIAADLIPGASPVTVTVLPGSGVTVANTPLLAKSAPALGAWLTANPQVLIQPCNQPPCNRTRLTWATIGAASCELGWDQTSTVIDYNGQAMPNPWTSSSTPPPPVQVTAAAPVTATIFQEEQFTLTAQGAVQVPSVQVVTIVPPSFTASANKVAPFVPFTLFWSCYDGTNPSLTWDSSGVSVTTSSGNTINSGDSVNLSDIATVLITQTTPGNAAVNFTLHAPPGSSSPAVQVSIEPVSLDNFTATNLMVDPNSPSGQQMVTLAWTAQNATGFTIYGPDGPPINLDHTVSSYLMRLPPNPQAPVTYSITAHGYAASGTEPTGQQTVVPIRVQTPGFSASPQQVTRGQNVTLTWNAVAATGYTVSLPGYPATYGFPANVFTVSLPTWSTPSMTWTITAHGYTAGGPEPSATVSVTVTKPPKEKEKDKEKEHAKEKESHKEDALEPLPFSRSPSSRGRSDAGLPSGTQQPFIDPSERPDVGAHLQGAGSSAPADVDE